MFFIPKAGHTHSFFWSPKNRIESSIHAKQHRQLNLPCILCILAVKIISSACIWLDTGDVRPTIFCPATLIFQSKDDQQSEADSALYGANLNRFIWKCLKFTPSMASFCYLSLNWTNIVNNAQYAYTFWRSARVRLSFHRSILKVKLCY